MKIGVDARLLSKPITGIGRYTLEMCRALSCIEGVSLYLYSPSPISLGLKKILVPSIIKSCNFNSLIFRQIWTEAYLPFWARQDEIDVFWGTAHRLPHWLPSRIARIVTIHDLVWKFARETMRPSSRILESYQMPAAIKKADHIVTISQSTADSLLEEFPIPKNKLTVVHLGSNHLKYKPDIQILKNMNINQPYFLFVGTLEPRKNLARLLIAYSKLPNVIKEQAMLLIAGWKGWGDVNLENIIKRLSLTQYTKILGYVDEPTLSTLYAYSRFLAMPSLYEGFGLPLIEAMIYGIPVLTSNNSSMIEVAGNAGILVDAMDIESIKNGLIKLIADDKLHQNLSLNAKKNACRFNWDFSAETLLSVFHQAVISRQGHRQVNNGC